MEQLSEIGRNLLSYEPDRPLSYTGLAFWIAFTAFLGIYALIYKRKRFRIIYLLVISWLIYYLMNGIFLILLILSCGINFFFGLRISRHKKTRTWLWVAVLFNLLVLGYFKYAYFFTDSINKIFHSRFEVFNWIGWLTDQATGSFTDLNTILLPVGISFYTFQAISYLADVHNKKIKALHNPLDFSFYISFFPQLVAGPIVRASAFIPQIYQKFHLSREEFGHAIFLITKGLIKKIVIADFLAVNFVDRVYGAPISFSGLENLLAVYAYSIQIYCDFSGYTDIAIGLALVLGFKIPVNFNSPYLANSLTDFWHRWHISLSLWLKDYLYIPLGGNRKGKIRTNLNLAVTMLLGGLWHGANIRFLIWGAIHGVALIVEKTVRRIHKTSPNQKQWKKLLSILTTFHIVSFAWIFFRAKDLETIRQMLFQIKYHFLPQITANNLHGYFPTIGIFSLGLVLIWFPFKEKEKIRGCFIRMPVVVQGVIILCILLAIAWGAQSGIQPFIYFRF